MFAYPLRTAALTICAAVGLAGCTGPYGYGGVSAGVGNSGYYDPYYGSGYGGYGGYGYGVGYPGYAAGYGFDPYWGWNDGFYYPGTGYYVYDRDRHRHRLTDAQRRYWELRRERVLSSGKQIVIRDNWGDFANHVDGRRQVQSGTSQAVQSSASEPVQVQRSVTRQTKAERSQVRSERRAVRAERVSERQQRRSEARSEGIGRSNGHRREESRED